MKRAALHFTLGIRGYYLLIPLAAWIMSKWFLIFVTIFYIITVRHLDYAEDDSYLVELIGSGDKNTANDKIQISGNEKLV